MNKRKFNWLSSMKDKNKADLEQLEKNMTKFYSELETRTTYNQMISNDRTEEGIIDDVTQAFLDWFSNNKFTRMLEVGCGTGRIRKLLTLPLESHYIGIEISNETIKENKKKWPMSDFYSIGVYEIEKFFKEPFDLIFSFYVLEHLVYPQRALDIMYENLKPNGYLVIACPDFCASGIFPSQILGLSNLQSAKNKFKKLKIFDAIVGYYDSRFKLKPALNKIKQQPGKFMVNINPACISLKKNEAIWPDCDAVYLANKEEIEYWAATKKMKVFYPKGKEGVFNEHVFMVLQKNN